MNQSVKLFIKAHTIVWIGIGIGLILGYLYWQYIGCYWGTYPQSSVCWVNCLTGGIVGGFISSFRKGSQ
ncbi:MAG: hypothetical protein LIP05_06980 [Tannerellaceae bacterium]|nr:hypothetical protein [Tannerellaceae bacterium]